LITFELVKTLKVWHLDDEEPKGNLRNYYSTFLLYLFVNKKLHSLIHNVKNFAVNMIHITHCLQSKEKYCYPGV